MNNSHKELLSMFWTLSIVVFATLIVHKFIPSLIWAGIIAIATYPLYQTWNRRFIKSDTWAALLFTTFFGIILLLPISWLITVLIQETQLLINYLLQINRNGGQPPDLLKEIPFIGDYLITYWNSHIAQPGSMQQFLLDLHLSLTPTSSYYLKQVGLNIVHRSFQISITLLTLFFFYRDGDKIFQQINLIGKYCLGDRWFRYAKKLPATLRATVNGTIMVGLGVGLLMGICYDLVQFPAPTLTGFITAFAAMIPFVVPVVFITVAIILLIHGNLIAGLIVLIWGTLVMFIADHFVKPVLIGGTIELPFLAVLFGILGGLENLGLLGLFVGPIIMGLFITLWQEPLELEIK